MPLDSEDGLSAADEASPACSLRRAARSLASRSCGSNVSTLEVGANDGCANAGVEPQPISFEEDSGSGRGGRSTLREVAGQGVAFAALAPPVTPFSFDGREACWLFRSISAAFSHFLVSKRRDGACLVKSTFAPARVNGDLGPCVFEGAFFGVLGGALEKPSPGPLKGNGALRGDGVFAPLETRELLLAGLASPLWAGTFWIAGRASSILLNNAARFFASISWGSSVLVLGIADVNAGFAKVGAELQPGFDVPHPPAVDAPPSPKPDELGCCDTFGECAKPALSEAIEYARSAGPAWHRAYRRTTHIDGRLCF